MKQVSVMALLLVMPALAMSQDGTHPYRGQGYLFIGEGVHSEDFAQFGISHVGGGGEVLLSHGIGVGAELGVMGRPGRGVGLFSVDPSYHFSYSSRKSKLVPFIEGGYTRAFDGRGFTYSENLLNFGAGFHYWPFKRVGLRLDFRDYIDHGFGATTQYPALRIGLAFR